MSSNGNGSRTRYPDEVKAQVLAALLAGQSANEVAKQYQIPVGTVMSWRSRQGNTHLATIATEKQDQIGELLFDYLIENIRTLRVQVEHFRSPEWLAKQPASEAAVLHGVLTDKSIRLLEALQAGRETEPDAIAAEVLE